MRTSSRIRHVKCGEEKPACLRCTSTGRKCDGYVPAGFIQLNIDVPGDHEERRGYHFFRLKSIGEILGHQDADFWKKLFLQVSYSEPAIKHALIAVAAIHESIDLSATAGYNDEVVRMKRAFSLAHYNRAIQLLTRHKQDSCDRLGVALIMCILFIVFEEFQSGFAAFALHLHGGLALLHQWNSSKAITTKPGTKLDYNENLLNHRVTPVLNRLLIVSSTFADNRIHAEMSKAYSATPFSLVMPPHFSSFAEARQALDEFMRWMFYSVNNPDQSSVPRIRAMLEQTLEDWLRASSHLLLGVETKLDSQDLRAARILRIYYHISFIIIDAYLSYDEMAYDRHITRFRAIISMSQEILSIDAGACGEHTLSFSFDFGVTPPLHFTASHCRDPWIRRRALGLLRRSHRKQGSWNSEHTAICAEEIIKIEEEGLGLVQTCNDVPKESRIRKVFADVLHEKRCINMVYVYHPYDLKTTVRSVHVPLRADEIQCRVSEHLAIGTKG